jgi:hypothetical protein
MTIVARTLVSVAIIVAGCLKRHGIQWDKKVSNFALSHCNSQISSALPGPPKFSRIKGLYQSVASFSST